MCHDCIVDEKYDFIDGEAPCRNAKNGCNCKHLEDLPERLSHLKGDPRNRITAGGLMPAIKVCGEISALSTRDANGIPNFDGAQVWTGEVPYTEDLFWSLSASIVSKRRSEAVEKLRSLRNG